nr:hypothetical protein L203_03647 [Cryptococcus depauperatus CBS 7841]
MPEYETITIGRARRSTAGNRMRELLERAHQEDEDELFKEVEDDEEFVAPPEQKDIFLDEFADTDDEVEDEDEEEHQIRREERKGKAKGRGYNPLSQQAKSSKKHFEKPEAGSKTKQDLSLLGEGIDPSNMAPTTLILELRKRRREAKRANRNESLRSNLRASTLKTESQVLQREAESRADPHRRGRRAMHEAKYVRIHKRLTQDELIAAALEEEERNKEKLRNWLKKEEEKRELRRVGRKVVKGPRWTWVSRTVEKLVEEVPTADLKEMPESTPTLKDPPTDLTTKQAEPSKYTRNYIILSQIPGGLPAELQIILGSHVEWDKLMVIPSRNRPINRQPPLCPLTGLPAKYRHPTTLIPYANKQGYAHIQSLLANRYIWNEVASCWMGGEQDVWAEGVGLEGVEGWAECVDLGWREGVEKNEEAEESLKRKSFVEETTPSTARTRARRR